MNEKEYNLLDDMWTLGPSSGTYRMQCGTGDLDPGKWPRSIIYVITGNPSCRCFSNCDLFAEPMNTCCVSMYVTIKSGELFYDYTF